MPVEVAKISWYICKQNVLAGRPAASSRRFLRGRREALAPASVGQQPDLRARRRTPGLRREGVAQVSGLSTTWYTWIEQGRDIALSAGALGRLADALCLNSAERAYLFELTRRGDLTAPAVANVPATAPGELLGTLGALSAPAYLLDRLWYARGWNEPARRLFAPWFDTDERCLLRFVFLTRPLAASSKAGRNVPVACWPSSGPTLGIIRTIPPWQTWSASASA